MLKVMKTNVVETRTLHGLDPDLVDHVKIFASSSFPRLSIEKYGSIDQLMHRMFERIEEYFRCVSRQGYRRGIATVGLV